MKPREHPIIFSAPMVRAILAKRKTQTRRVVSPKLTALAHGKMMEDEASDWCPYGRPGDRLWVRETFLYRARKTIAIYRADLDPCEAAGVGALWGGWKPSIHMPRRFSRITLEITGVRVQRVQEITREDAAAEGVTCFHPASTYAPGQAERFEFRQLWDSLNKKRGFGWDTNCWIWCLTFKRV